MEGRAVRPHEMLEWPNPDGEKGGRAEGSFGRSVGRLGSRRTAEQEEEDAMRQTLHRLAWLFFYISSAVSVFGLRSGCSRVWLEVPPSCQRAASVLP